MVSKIIIEKYGRRMLPGNNPNWHPKEVSVSIVTKDEMMKELDSMAEVCDVECQSCNEEILNAIRATIVKLGEWQKRAQRIRTNRRTDFDTPDDSCLAAELIENIRNFGKD